MVNARYRPDSSGTRATFSCQRVQCRVSCFVPLLCSMPLSYNESMTVAERPPHDDLSTAAMLSIDGATRTVMLNRMICTCKLG